MQIIDPSFDPKFSKVKVSTYSSGGTSEEAIRARIEAEKLEIRGEGLNNRPLANKSKKVICDGLKYKNPDYVEEAKRRGIGAENCASFVPVVKTPQLNVSGKIKERLTKLKELLDKGLLTPDEAAEKRKEILNSL